MTIADTFVVEFVTSFTTSQLFLDLLKPAVAIGVALYLIYMLAKPRIRRSERVEL